VTTRFDAARTYAAIVDIAPDCYGVTWLSADRCRITHYPTQVVATPCCVIEVTRRPGESEGAALHRAYLLGRDRCRHSADLPRPSEA
jgi:hypothetical protein